MTAPLSDPITFEEAKARLESSVYQAAMLFEKLEDKGQVHGNGHHMAQKIGQAAVQLLTERWVNRSEV